MEFRKYILDTERILSAPVTGDDFDFQINESLSIECEIVEHTEDSYTVEMDEAAWAMLVEANLVIESEICTECSMGTLYNLGETKMRCDECGYTMTNEAKEFLHRARDSNIDVDRDSIGDGYFIGHDIHDDGDAVKVAYNLYYLENPEGLENTLVDAFREVGYLNVSPYRAKPEEIQAAAAQLKIKDQINKKIKSTESVEEAKYQGREVSLGRPSAGDVKKYKVYVRDPKTGNIKKVNFGDKKMSIKRDNPARRKNFRARHNCSSKKDRTSAGYWSCRMWSNKPVSKILKGK